MLRFIVINTLGLPKPLSPFFFGQNGLPAGTGLFHRSNAMGSFGAEDDKLVSAMKRRLSQKPNTVRQANRHARRARAAAIRKAKKQVARKSTTD